MIAGRWSLKIVVAEDDDLIGELLAEMLTSMGHVVCAVEASETGTVEAARRFQPELLIVDLHLSPGCGIAAVDRITRMRPVAHVLMSANIVKLRALRPDAVMLEKPFTLASLARAKRLACGRDL